MIPCSKMEAPLVCIEVGGAILRPPGQGQRIQEAGGAGTYAGVHRPLRRNYGTKQRRADHRDLLIRSQPKGTLLGLAHGNLVSYTATLRCLEDTLYRTSWGSDVDLIVHGLSLARFPLNETSDAPRGGAAFHG